MKKLNTQTQILVSIFTGTTALMLFSFSFGLGGWLGVLPLLMAGIYTMSCLSTIIDIFTTPK